MRSCCVPQASSLKGELALLGDKSIAHRCIIVSAIAQGKTTLKNFPTNKDCQYSVAAFKKLGIKIKQSKNRSPVITVWGKGLYGLSKPSGPIFVGDSGTTLRLLLGILAGQDFKVKLVAGKSLSHRPMLRVSQPLRMMGAEINGQRTSGQTEEYPPITIRGGGLSPITYKMPIASAQVKSAILLAGLYNNIGILRVVEPVRTRDHTERILRLFGADIKVQANTIVIKGGRELASPGKIYIPGDISSASFFIVAAAILPDSEILIKKVSLNPLRSGVIKVLKRMGAEIKVTRSQGHKVTSYEPIGDVLVRSSKLRATLVKKEEIPSLIDELPILMVAASVAKGKTVFEGISELRVKETDRIASMSGNLKKMGADIKVIKMAKSENMIIAGIKQLKNARVITFGDHRTAMSMVVAGLKAKGKTIIDDITCINKSFPEFLLTLNKLILK